MVHYCARGRAGSHDVHTHQAGGSAPAKAGQGLVYERARSPRTSAHPGVSASGILLLWIVDARLGGRVARDVRGHLAPTSVSLAAPPAQPSAATATARRSGGRRLAGAPPAAPVGTASAAAAAAGERFHKRVVGFVGAREALLARLRGARDALRGVAEALRCGRHLGRVAPPAAEKRRDARRRAPAAPARADGGSIFLFRRRVARRMRADSRKTAPPSPRRTARARRRGASSLGRARRAAADRRARRGERVQIDLQRVAVGARVRAHGAPPPAAGRRARSSASPRRRAPQSLRPAQGLGDAGRGDGAPRGAAQAAPERVRGVYARPQAPAGTAAPATPVTRTPRPAP